MFGHRLVKCQLFIFDSRRILFRVSGIDTIHTGTLKDDIGLDLKSPERRARVCREERTAGSSGDEGHAPLLQHLDGVVTVIVAYKRFHRSG